MKRISFFLFGSLLGVLLFITSCKKDETENPNFFGFWKGDYSTSPMDLPTVEFVYSLVKANGQIQEWYDLDTSSTNTATAAYTIPGNSMT